MSPRAFAIVLGVVMILGGLLLGADRFSASADGVPAQCVSVFDGKGLTYDNNVVLPKEMFGSWRGDSGDTPLVNACDAKRDQYRLFVWLLVGGGVALTAGAFVIRPAKTEGR